MPLPDEFSSEAGRGTLNDMRQRLDQLGEQIDRVRNEVPQPQADMLGRIEDGIGGLAEGIAALAHQRRPISRAHGAAAAREEESPWDAEAAEALTRVYEQAAAEERFNPQPAAPRLPPPLPMHARAGFDRPAEGLAEAARERAWMEQRLADIASLIGQSVAGLSREHTVASLAAALAERLGGLEQRLDAALAGSAQAPDTRALETIEAQIGELSSQLEATRGELGRLDAIDEQLRDLAHMLEGHRMPAQAAAGSLSVETVKSLIDTAAERAASRLAATLPAAEGGDDMRARLEALEGLLQDYVAERRGGDDASEGVLEGIEQALSRIVDRIEAIEIDRPQAAEQDDDGLAIESERLAEAYAVGARVLGQTPFESSLSATDYSPSAPASAPAAATEHETREPAPEAAEADAHALQELRASALRAKLKAQGQSEPPPLPAEALAADPARSPIRRQRAKARAGAPRFGLLLLAAMTTLFGVGYLAVDVMVTGASSTANPAPAAAQMPARMERDGADLQPAKAESAPAEAPAFAPAPTPADDATHSEPPGTPRQRARADAKPSLTPISLRQMPVQATTPVREAAPPLAEVGAALGVETLPPPEIGTAALRYAAAGGDAAAQFEVASRFADGKGVAPDPAQAFLWYQRAATRGHVAAQFRLGAAYERGIGTSADAERAKIWYRRAADQGHARAMHNLAVLLVGTDRARADYAGAAHWFARAAVQGLADSQYNIGLLYENGLGVSADPEQAAKWYGLAARAGDREAARRLELLKARTP